jgi:hypothetical protein
MDGRVNCLGERSLCFKSYSRGSYFGDVEVFCKCPRLFAVRAECSTTLALINVIHLESAFKVYRESRIRIMKRAIERMLKINIGMKRIEPFDMIIRNDPFWKVSDRADDLLHPMIVDWLDSFATRNPDGLSE